MALRFFNTLSRTIEPFAPLDPNGRRVRMYCCGPTVHDFAHIGNFRTFVFADLVRRFLDWRGYDVTHVMNVTDVEDKIIARLQADQTPLREYTARYETAFLQDLDTLGCLRPHHLPHATDHIPEMLDLIQRLLERAIAYRTPDGSVYFSIAKYRSSGHHYGQLLNLSFEGMRPGERVATDEYEKEAVADFALWKARTPSDGPVFWQSPWGDGRPGWHIECSAMSMKLLGPSFDLHLGGEDLIFPHHEDEIAQSEGAALQTPGQRFVQCWLHGAHLLVEGKKMSKSLGNFFTLRDLIGRGFAGREIRFLLLSAHYRETFNFTFDGLQGARTALGRIDECIARLRDIAGSQPADAPNPALPGRVSEALDADLNVSSAWAAVFDWVRTTNRDAAENRLSPDQAAAHLASWNHVNRLLGIEPPADDTVPEPILALVEARQLARKSRDFQQADVIREELASKGWVVEDTPKGPRAKRA